MGQVALIEIKLNFIDAVLIWSWIFPWQFKWPCILNVYYRYPFWGRLSTQFTKQHCNLASKVWGSHCVGEGTLCYVYEIEASFARKYNFIYFSLCLILVMDCKPQQLLVSNQTPENMHNLLPVWHHAQAKSSSVWFLGIKQAHSRLLNKSDYISHLTKAEYVRTCEERKKKQSRRKPVAQGTDFMIWRRKAKKDGDNRFYGITVSWKQMILRSFILYIH